MDKVSVRASLIREWCRGEGLLSNPDPVAIKQADLELFGVEDSISLKRMLVGAINLLDKEQQALLRNALGQATSPHKTLTDRRRRYEEEHGISSRTVLRHEEAAVIRLAEVIETLLSPQSDSASLAERVSDLEKVAVHAHEFVVLLIRQLNAHGLDTLGLQNTLFERFDSDFNDALERVMMRADYSPTPAT